MDRGAVAAAHAEYPSRLSAGVGLTGLTAAAILTAVTAGMRSALAVGVIAWLFDNGFLVHRFGDLRWDGASDAGALALLVGCALVTALLGASLRSRHSRPVGPLGAAAAAHV